MKNLFAISCFGSSGGCFARSFFLKNSLKNKLKNFAKNQLAIIFATSLAMMGMVSEGWSACTAGTATTSTGTTGCTAGYFCQSGTAGQALANDAAAGTCTTKLATSSPCTAGTGGDANNACSSGYCCSSTCSANSCTSASAAVSGAAAAKNFQNTVDNNSLVTVLCKAYLLANGTAGKTIAAFAIISAGIGFFTGKVSWGLLIGISIGIGTMFGAPTIVAAISGSSYDTSSCKTVSGVYNDGTSS